MDLESRESFNEPLSLQDQLNRIAQEAEGQQQKIRKRSFLLPKNTSDEFVDNVANDDDIEREEIRKAALEDENRRRKEAEAHTKRQGYKQLTNISPREIEEHYNRCIQLCNQNKVNKNNAFKLQLIDYMNLIIKQPEHTTNLTLAGCTLDASAKIYACRVDKAYADMLMAISGNKKANDETEGSGDENNENEGGIEGEPKKKKKKKSTSDDLDLDKFLMSEIELKKDRGRDEDAAFLLKGRSILPPNAEHFMDCPLFGPLAELRLDCPLNYYDDDSMFSQPKPITSVSKISESTPVDPAKHVPGYKDLQKKFTVVRDEESVVESTAGVLTTMIDKALIFEPLEPEEIEHAPFVDEDEADDNAPYYEIDYDACDVEDVPFPSLPVVATSLNTNPSKTSNRFSVGGLSKFIAINSSDYSYFDDSKVKFHATPMHWSLKSRRPVDRFAGPVGKPKSNPMKSILINFSCDRYDSLKKEFLTQEAPSLAKKTMESWSKSKIKFSYCAYTAKKLLSFAINEDLLYVDKDLKSSKVSVVNQDIDDAVMSSVAIPSRPGSDQDSDHDRDDCELGGDALSPIREIESRLSQRFSSGFDAEPFASCGVDELIPAPPKVEQIQVNYAKFQKRVDIKALKATVWTFLDLEDKENCNDKQRPQGKPRSSVEFSAVVKNIPKLVSAEEAPQLSVPILFMSVLHLVNEKNLKLTHLENDKGNFLIQLNDQ